MDPVPLIAIKPGSYAPKPTMKAPVPNSDEQVVAHVASSPTQPSASVHEFNKRIQQTAASAAQDIQNFIASQSREVRLSKDSVSGHMVVQLVDPSTGAVIRTLPSEELLRLARTFQTLGNVLVNQKA
jgi:flagellar protein FlaG